MNKNELANFINLQWLTLISYTKCGDVYMYIANTNRVVISLDDVEFVGRNT